MSGWGTIYSNTSYALSCHAQALARLQEQAASGMRINRSSDSPGDAYSIMRLNTQSRQTEGYVKNLEGVVRGLEFCHNAVQNINDSVSRAQQLLTQAASATYGATNRAAMAAEIDSLLEQIVSIVNGQSLGRYVFGGVKTTTAPYAVERDGGKITSVTYQGSQTDLLVPVAQGVERSGLLVGDRAFRADSRQGPEFLGATGAAAGTATSSVRGDVWLSVSHTATVYEGASGVAAGTLSAGQDTVIGTHTVTIEAAGQTIRLDSGPAVTFTGTEDNLELTNESDDVACVDMTGWAAAGSPEGTFAVQASGTLSVDDGASSTAIAFSDNVAVTDSQTGRILYVDATGITRTGAEAVRVPGTYDLFSALISIRDLMNNERSLTESQQVSLLSQAMDSVKEVQAVVTRQMTVLGGKLQAMDSLRATLEDAKATADQQAGSLQNADLTLVAIELARTQNLYDLTLAAAAQLLRLNLLDYIT
ncbi:MAG TPA: flagellar hook-associated protein FlgL [Phycisphaerae bacterium]|nr:flagellar hook-associated protein FlgL [Phycisphaerae bacterium]HUT59977.1 flagellar hook-associated protein FlgL [Phycisphaerae bacterium]